jgi:molybdate transport system substrate-binding protein
MRFPTIRPSIRRMARAACAIGLLGIFIAFNASTPTPAFAAKAPAADSVKLTVSAAASLRDALMEITQIFRRSHPGVDVALNFGASGTLELQIERGAPVDVFISAAAEQMNALSARKLLVETTRVDLLQNELVLIVPRNSTAPAAPASFRDLARPGVRLVALGDPRSVPAGHYAQEVLTALGIYNAVKAKAVFASDVRQVLADVETGSADAGLVYATDAGISPRVRVVAEAPPGTHEPIEYPAAVLAATQSSPAHAAAARAYVEFLETPASRAIFTKYGFRPAEKSATH